MEKNIIWLLPILKAIIKPVYNCDLRKMPKTIWNLTSFFKSNLPFPKSKLKFWEMLPWLSSLLMSLREKSLFVLPPARRDLARWWSSWLLRPSCASPLQPLRLAWPFLRPFWPPVAKVWSFSSTETLPLAHIACLKAISSLLVQKSKIYRRKESLLIN